MGDLAADAVLDPQLTCRPVLLGERDQVPFAEPVVLVGQLDLPVPEFAPLGTEVLGAGVQPIDLMVRGVRDQCDLSRVAGFLRSAQRWTACSPASSRVSARCSCPRER